MAGVEAASLSPVPVPKQWNVGQVANLPKHGRLAICPALAAPQYYRNGPSLPGRSLFPLPSGDGQQAQQAGSRQQQRGASRGAAGR